MLELLMPPQTQLLTKEEAARRLRVTLERLNKLIAAGHLEVFTLDGVPKGDRIREADLERYVRGGGAKP